MTNPSDRLVGNSFRLGYRFQRYWDTSMALAFFFAEIGTGLFAISFHFDFIPGMIAGLAIAGTLKPYFHLAHMGVPGKSWRALARPDRSWVSRGAFAIGVMMVFGVIHVANKALGLGLPQQLAQVVAYLALGGCLVVMCYQGFAMSASESFTLWATPLLPLASFAYASTAGLLCLGVLGHWGLSAEQMAWLARAGAGALIVDLIVVSAILMSARRKSKGGEFSVNLLVNGQYAPTFRNRVFVLGQIIPAAILFFAGARLEAQAAALVAMLVGFYAFRIHMFRAAVYEPITHDLAGSIGLPVRP